MGAPAPCPMQETSPCPPALVLPCPKKPVTPERRSHVEEKLMELRQQVKADNSPLVSNSAPNIAVLGCFLINRPDLAIDMLDSIDHPVETLVVVHMSDSNPETNK